MRPNLKVRTTANDFLNEVIIFGGIPTLRGDVVNYLTAHNFPQKAIEIFAYTPKSVDMKAVPAARNPALRENTARLIVKIGPGLLQRSEPSAKIRNE